MASVDVTRRLPRLASPGAVAALCRQTALFLAVQTLPSAPASPAQPSPAQPSPAHSPGQPRPAMRACKFSQNLETAPASQAHTFTSAVLANRKHACHIRDKIILYTYLLNCHIVLTHICCKRKSMTTVYVAAHFASRSIYTRQRSPAWVTTGPRGKFAHF